MGLYSRVSIICLLAFTASSASANCGSAFCSINTNSEIQSDSAEPGFHLNLRYEFDDLDQPRQGSKKVGVLGEPGGHDELQTTNHNLILGMDYVINQNWGVGVQVPYLKRKHEHIHNPDDEGIAAGEEAEREEWDLSGVGDVRVSGRYQLETGSIVIGLHGGLKLPTGKFRATNNAGEEAERTLQLGTGSTDIVVGAFAKGTNADTPLRWFVQSQWQHAIATKDGFRPGDDITLDLGLRYGVTHAFATNVQLNTRYKRRDSGANSEPDESGGTYIYFSPGMSYAFATGTQIYAFVQVPLYQSVNGVQLTPSTSYVVGLNYRF